MDALLNFLGKILPPEGDGYRCGTAIGREGKTFNRFYKTNLELANFIVATDKAGASAYFACSSYVDPNKGRLQTNVKSIKAFWLDIDAGDGKPYANVKEAEDAVIKFVADANIITPLLVCSGNGVHAYFVLDNPMSEPDWKKTAKAFKGSVRRSGLFADHARTSDSASILRPIETKNRKNKEHPLDVYIIKDAPSFENSLFVDKINPNWLPAVSNDEVGQSILGGLNDREFPPNYGSMVAKKCNQLKSFAELRGVVSEQVWYANLGVLAYCEDGEELAQRWSSGHSNYSEAETSAKLDQARRKQTGPTTCARFKELNEEGCTGCPFAVTTPTQAGKEVEEKPPLIVEEKKPWLPTPYYWGPNMQIMCKVKIEEVEKEVIVCDQPFYIDTMREEETLGEQGKQSVKFKTRTPFSKWKSFTIPVETLNSSNGMSVLSAYGPMCETGMEKQFVKLVKGMINGRKKMRELDISYNSFGWKDDNQIFVLGREGYKVGGSIGEISGTPEVEKAADLLRRNPKGSLNGWRRAANKLFSAGNEAQGLAVVSSFASILMQFATSDNEGGAMVSLYSSKSGQGKTTALIAGESVWGLSGALTLTNGESVKAKFKAIANRKNLPVFNDEWGRMDTNILAGQIDTFTSGRDIRRLAISAEDIKTQGVWKNIFIGSTNAPIVDILNNANEHAKAIRIMEIELSLPKNLSASNTSELQDEFQLNAGYAGPAFLVHLMKNYNLNSIRSDLYNLVNIYTKHMGIKDQDYRYNIRWLSCWTVAANILTSEKFGDPLLTFYPKPYISHAMDIIKENKTAKRGVKTAADYLSCFIKDNMQNFVIVEDSFNPKIPTILVHQPKFALMGRYEKKEQRLFIPNDLMHKYAAENRISYQELSRELVRDGVVRNRNRQTKLAAGVDILTPVTTPCWEIDLSHPKMEGIEPLKTEL